MRPPQSTAYITAHAAIDWVEWRLRASVLIAIAVGLSATNSGCTSVIEGRGYDIGGSGIATSGGGSAGSNVGSSGSGPDACQSTFNVPTRLARITDAQIANAIGEVFGPAALTTVTVADPKTRDFIAIQDSLNSTVLDKYVQTAVGALDALSNDSIAKLGGCSTNTLDEACAKKVISTVAEKFYRRPVTADELTSLNTAYSDTISYGIPVATRAALSAILTAPPTIYRTEFGSGAHNGSTSLTSYEVASELSFMLSDTIPDDALLAAAKGDQLKTPEQIKAQVNRLLATDAVRKNLTRVMLANYGVGNLFGTTKDPKLFPAYTPALETSLYTETKLFVDNILWHGKVSDLLLSPQTYIDPSLATLYGVTYPGQPGGGFVPYTFGPNERAGLLTQGSILAIAANPDNTSVVHRGLFVHGKLMCLGVNPPPASLQAQINALSAANLTEKAKADFRDKTPPCNGCHLSFDQYGLALEHYDAIGRFRQTYPDGTAIDSSVKLPADLGAVAAQGVGDMSSALANNPVFATCIAEQLTGYGLGFQLNSDVSGDCSISKAYGEFMSSGSGTFADMVRAVATSDALLVRKVSQ